MIPIKKSAKLPKILEDRGKKTTQENSDEFSANKADYENGAKKFKFDSGIYGSKSVKNALIKTQHGKCFLCESKITHISFGDVEHFRPKGGSRQTADEKEMKVPGYFWLAYDWQNLFLACQLCNQRFKKNLFPLENPDERAFSEAELENEKPLFINPEIENPEEFISFRGEIAFSVDGNLRGETTIEETGINRDELKEMRLATLKKLKKIYVLANLNPKIPESEEALKFLEDCTAVSHEYASAVRANLENGFRFVLK
jgi:uncharacterized protein (TIGR02646 family)